MAHGTLGDRADHDPVRGAPETDHQGSIRRTAWRPAAQARAPGRHAGRQRLPGSAPGLAQPVAAGGGCGGAGRAVRGGRRCARFRVTEPGRLDHCGRHFERVPGPRAAQILAVLDEYAGQRERASGPASAGLHCRNARPVADPGQRVPDRDAGPEGACSVIIEQAGAVAGAVADAIAQARAVALSGAVAGAHLVAVASAVAVAVADPEANSHADAHAHADTHGHFDPDADPDTNADGHVDRCAVSHADADALASQAPNNWPVDITVKI